MRGDLLLLLADAIAILCITRFLLRYAGLAAEQPLLKFSIQATGWLTKPWQKAFPSGEKTDWYCLPSGFLVYYLACPPFFCGLKPLFRQYSCNFHPLK